jgi:hypothetical protein
MSISTKEIARQYNRVKVSGWLSWFQSAARKADTSTAHLLAIGSRETNLKNIKGDFRNGRYNGFGVMQVDVGTDAEYARNWSSENVEPAIRRGAEIYASKVDQVLEGQGKRLSVRGNRFVGKKIELDDARRIATAGYNSGLWGYYHFSKGEHVDSTTTGHDYSRDVYNRAIEFADLLSNDGTEPDALIREVELQGKYATPESRKRAKLEPIQRESLPMGEPMEDRAELGRADSRNNPEPEELDASPVPVTSDGGPKTTIPNAQDTDAPAVSVPTVTPAKEPALKRLLTALGLGGVGIGTYLTQLGGYFKSVDPYLIKWVIYLGLGALMVYLVGQFINGMFDRWSAHQLNIVQAQSARDRTVNTIQFVPGETGNK